MSALRARYAHGRQILRSLRPLGITASVVLQEDRRHGRVLTERPHPER